MAIALVLVAGVVALVIKAGDDGSASTGPSSLEAVTVGGPAPAQVFPATGSAGEADPVPTEAAIPSGILPSKLLIPAIEVETEVVELDIRGPAPEVPSDFDQAGWYVQTRLPGEIGPSVIVGHIDSKAGPAIFYDLNKLEVGDEVIVLDAAGAERTFVVIGSGQFPKSDLPPEVFGFGDPTPQLRLITCGGTFDRSTGHYQDNYVVYTQELVT